MAGSYDGSIRINTAVNAAPFDNCPAQIENRINSMTAAFGAAFGEHTDKYIAEDRARLDLFPTASSYTRQTTVGGGFQQAFEFPIVIDGVTTETVKTNTETVLRPDWHDPMIDNGGGR